jgi:hypothetical protein
LLLKTVTYTLNKKKTWCSWCHPLVMLILVTLHCIVTNYTRLSRGHCILNLRTVSSGWVREPNLWTKGLGRVDRVEWNFWYLSTEKKKHKYYMKRNLLDIPISVGFLCHLRNSVDLAKNLRDSTRRLSCDRTYIPQFYHQCASSSQQNYILIKLVLTSNFFFSRGRRRVRW